MNSFLSYINKKSLWLFFCCSLLLYTLFLSNCLSFKVFSCFPPPRSLGPKPLLPRQFVEISWCVIFRPSTLSLFPSLKAHRDVITSPLLHSTRLSSPFIPLSFFFCVWAVTMTRIFVNNPRKYRFCTFTQYILFFFFSHSCNQSDDKKNFCHKDPPIIWEKKSTQFYQWHLHLSCVNGKRVMCFFFSSSLHNLLFYHQHLPSHHTLLVKLLNFYLFSSFFYENSLEIWWNKSAFLYKYYFLSIRRYSLISSYICTYLL